MDKEFTASKDFLSTFEWRKVRQEAFLKYGNKCMCCGARPVGDVYLCVDHILPRKTHPELALELNNLQILCNVCNHGKGNWNTTDWREDSEFIITKDWLNKFTKGGAGITRERASAVGLEYPVSKGWFKRLLGKSITNEQRIRFENGLSRKDKKVNSEKENYSNQNKLEELLKVEKNITKLLKQLNKNLRKHNKPSATTSPSQSS